MRGKANLGGPVSEPVRITPACAGKSIKCCKRIYTSRDYPRVCGEKYKMLQEDLYKQGLPPRVRGKGAGGEADSLSVRITPACAGKSQPVQVRRAGDGITPARAGKRHWLLSYRQWARDHPRACGEKAQQDFGHVGIMGSPPRVRGKDGSQLVVAECTGITPARAGKSARENLYCELFRDHPRACGEKVVFPYGQTTYQGSPPRVRGKALGTVAFIPRVGITPARAGKRQTEH